MAQRLVRLICAHCKRPARVDPQALEESGLDPGARADAHASTRARAASTAAAPGFKGRTAICELLDLSDRIREMILDRRPASEIKKAAQEEGMRFLRESAVEKVLLGHDDAPRNQQGDVRRMSAFARWLAVPPADAAIEIAPERGVRCALTVAADGGVRAYAIEPLPAGALVASLTAANMVDRGAVVVGVAAVARSVRHASAACRVAATGRDGARVSRPFR